MATWKSYSAQALREAKRQYDRDGKPGNWRDDYAAPALRLAAKYWSPYKIGGSGPSIKPVKFNDRRVKRKRKLDNYVPQYASTLASPPLLSAAIQNELGAPSEGRRRVKISSATRNKDGSPRKIRKDKGLKRGPRSKKN
jgi:hypothetical protein